jgi:hypothetical protein
LVEAACWVHARRPLFILADVAANARRKAQGKTASPISPLALEAVQRIDALFDIERSINGQSAEQRRAVRQELSTPLVADLEHDAASIMTSRRRRRAKTDRIDGEALLRALMAHKRGEPRVCAMVRVPTPEDEDRRRISRERHVLIAERVAHVNRIKGLLFSQGIRYEPLRFAGFA